MPSQAFHERVEAALWGPAEEDLELRDRLAATFPLEAFQRFGTLLDRRRLEVCLVLIERMDIHPAPASSPRPQP